MTQAEYNAAVIQAHRDYRDAVQQHDRASLIAKASKDQVDATEAKLRQLARVEVKP